MIYIVQYTDYDLVSLMNELSRRKKRVYMKMLRNEFETTESARQCVCLCFVFYVFAVRNDQCSEHICYLVIIKLN